MRKERALLDEDLACNAIHRELQSAEFDLKELHTAGVAGNLDASPDQVELQRSQLQKERARIEASDTACDRALDIPAARSSGSGRSRRLGRSSR